MKIIIVRIGDGDNFRRSMKYKTWGTLKMFKSLQSCLKNEAILCFVTSGKNGRIIAFADFHSINERLHSNEELGWVLQPDQENWKYEIKYTNMYETDNSEKYRRTFRGQNSIIEAKNEEAGELYKLYLDTILSKMDDLLLSVESLLN